jgi:hypothetical protein
MLISRREGAINIVTQPDHGRLAGVMARHWGNDEFAPSSLQDDLVHVADFHDDGWVPLDSAPFWNADAQRPAHFLEVPLPVTAAAYKLGVDAIYDARPIAGVLESMHFTGFYRSRWGVDQAPHVDHPDVAGIVEFEEDRRARAIRDNWPQEQPRADFEREIWHSYEILQVLDLLSLCMCLVDPAQPSSSESVVMARTLFSIDQEATQRVILRAPRTRERDRVDMTVRVTEPHVFEVEPFPFDQDELSLEVPERRMEERYDSEQAAGEAYRSASAEVRKLTVVGAGRS